MLPILPIVCALLAAPNQEAEDRWIADLRSEDEIVRRNAALALLQRGPEGVPRLLRELRHERPEVPGQVERWMKRLEEERWRDRAEAAAALVALGSHGAPHLERHRDHEILEVRWRVRAALEEIGERAPREREAERRGDAVLCEVLGEIGDERCVPDLLRSAETAEGNVRMRAALALVRMREKLTGEQRRGASEAAFAALAAETDEPRRVLLVAAVGDLGCAESAAELGAVLGNESAGGLQMRRAAIFALGKIGTAEALALVIRALAAEDEYVRDAALVVVRSACGSAHGFDARRSAREQAKAVAEIREWWGKKFGRRWEP